MFLGFPRGICIGVTSYSLVNGNQHFGDTFFLHVPENSVSRSKTEPYKITYSSTGWTELAILSQGEALTAKKQFLNKTGAFQEAGMMVYITCMLRYVKGL